MTFLPCFTLSFTPSHTLACPGTGTTITHRSFKYRLPTLPGPALKPHPLLPPSQPVLEAEYVEAAVPAEPLPENGLTDEFLVGTDNAWDYCILRVCMCVLCVL